MLIVLSSGTLVKKLFMSKEHIWSDKQELLRIISTKLNESFTQKSKNLFETGLITEIKNLAILYCAEFIVSSMGLHGMLLENKVKQILTAHSEQLI